MNPKSFYAVSQVSGMFAVYQYRWINGAKIKDRRFGSYYPKREPAIVRCNVLNRQAESRATV